MRQISRPMKTSRLMEGCGVSASVTDAWAHLSGRNCKLGDLPGGARLQVAFTCRACVDDAPDFSILRATVVAPSVSSNVPSQWLNLDDKLNAVPEFGGS